MTENITNIINYDALTGIRHSGNPSLMPKTNTLVSLELIERLDKGVKVLIDGKLFIAIIDEIVPLKEELLAWVTSVNKFSLTLNFEKQLAKNRDFLLKEITHKLKIPYNKSTENILEKIIKEKKPLIKSKVIQLLELMDEVNVDHNKLQLMLLINIVWHNSANENNFAKDIVNNLFNESFEDVCKQFAESTKELLFTEIPPFIIKEINNKIIFDEGTNNTIALGSKTEAVIGLIKYLNDFLEINKYKANNLQIVKFIKFGSRYILQKLVLQEYNYYPDFIIAKRNNDLALIMVEIKKYLINNSKPVYNLKFKYKNEPIELDGLLKDYFLIGNIMTDTTNYEQVNNKVEIFRKNLWQKRNIGSNISINKKEQNRSLEQLSNLQINKLVS